MGTIKKVLVVLLVTAPLYFVAQALIYIIGVILLLIVMAYALAGQGKYKRTIRDAGTRSDIDSIRRNLEDINRKL